MLPKMSNCCSLTNVALECVVDSDPPPKRSAMCSEAQTGEANAAPASTVIRLEKSFKVQLRFVEDNQQFC